MKSERMKGFGERLKQARINSLMSQDHVASCLRVTRQSVSAWERGVASPSAVQLAELSELLCVCAHALLFGETFAKSAIQAMLVRKIGQEVAAPPLESKPQEPCLTSFFRGVRGAIGGVAGRRADDVADDLVA